MPGNFANGTTLHLALRETREIILDRRTLAVFAIIVGVFAVTGPFGTLEKYSFPERLGFWLVAQAMSWSIAILSIRLADLAFGQSLEPEALRIVLTGALAGIPVSLVSLAFGSLAWRDGDMLTLDGAMRTVTTSVPLTIAFSALCWLAVRAPAPADTRDDPVRATPAIPAILARLPVDKRGRLLRLSAADHYVEVATERGRSLVLLRLADAIAETEPVTGMKIHRSHWVSLDAVDEVITQDGRAIAIIADGTTVPVSRSCVAELRRRIDAGRK